MHRLRIVKCKLQRAFTLIELLAVVVILGLSAAVAGVGLSGRSASAQLMDAQSALTSLDAMARIFARQSHTVELRIDPTVPSLILIDLCCENTVFAERSLSNRITIEAWEVRGGASIEAVRYNALGHSTDYTVRISRESASQSLTFAGLTGWHAETAGRIR